MIEVTGVNLNASTSTADPQTPTSASLVRKIEFIGNKFTPIESSAASSRRASISSQAAITIQPLPTSRNLPEMLEYHNSIETPVEPRNRERSNDLKSSIKNFICKSWVNIFQCGPKAQLFCVDFKCTPTFVCQSDKIFCFLCHPEVGVSTPQLFPWTKSYVLAIHNQCGFGVTFNSSFNPKEWSFYGVVEKLEHFEVTLPLVGFDVAPFNASAQTLFAVESGKTTILKDESLKGIIKQAFCEAPTATAKLFYQVVKDKLHPGTHQDSLDNNTLPLSLPDILRASQHALASAVISTLHAASQSENQEETFWFGVTFGLCDINSAKTWGMRDIASFSLQLNNYFRLNCMFTYKNGKFAIPDNIAEFLLLLRNLLGSSQKIQQFFNEVATEINAASHGNAMIESLSSQFLNDLSEAIKVSSYEQEENNQHIEFDKNNNLFPVNSWPDE